MRLQSFHVKTYRNFVDSGEVEASESVTCLVGKNESGKTALLQGLHALNPANNSLPPDLTDDYPRWLKKEHELAKTIGTAPPITATFELDEADQEAFSDCFGASLTSAAVTVSLRYGGGYIVSSSADEAEFVKWFVENLDADEVRTASQAAKTVGQLKTAIQAVETKAVPDGDAEGNPALVQRARDVRADLENLIPKGDFGATVRQWVIANMPRFFYFGQYEMLPGRSDMGRLLAALDSNDSSVLAEGEGTAVDLLRLASTDADNLDSNFEVTTAELEAVANLLTKRVREYWHQNKHLRLEIAVEPEYGPNPHGGSAILVRRWLQLRVNDTRHDYTNNLDRRSTGFRWFASFFSAFFEFEGDDNVIVLLDEPGLHLHGSAQKDLLDFIDERLTGSRQVLYSTHSPWMIPPDLARVRVVEDAEEEEHDGAVVTDRAATRDPDTLFPLQAALGYDLAQLLFIGEDNLAVEGVSDFLYLTLVSSHLGTLGREQLDPRWRILPCGSADNIPAFVNLMGPHLRVTVLLDSGARPNQRIDNLLNKGILTKNRVITIGGVLDRTEGDIEDLFTDADYLRLYNLAFPQPKLKASDLKGDDRIVARIERRLGVPFVHGTVAEALMRRQEGELPKLSVRTLEAFAKLISAINATLN